MKGEYWNLYKDEEIPLPEPASEKFENMHPYNQWIQIHHELENWSPSQATVKRARRGLLLLRKGKYKYVWVHKEAPLLFDLENDPLEKENLAGKDKYKKIEKELKEELLDGLDLEELESQIIKSQQERLMMLDALDKGKKRTWDIHKEMI